MCNYSKHWKRLSLYQDWASYSTCCFCTLAFLAADTDRLITADVCNIWCSCILKTGWLSQVIVFGYGCFVCGSSHAPQIFSENFFCVLITIKTSTTMFVMPLNWCLWTRKMRFYCLWRQEMWVISGLFIMPLRKTGWLLQWFLKKGFDALYKKTTST